MDHIIMSPDLSLQPFSNLLCKILQNTSHIHNFICTTKICRRQYIKSTFWQDKRSYTLCLIISFRTIAWDRGFGILNSILNSDEQNLASTISFPFSITWFSFALGFTLIFLILFLQELGFETLDWIDCHWGLSNKPHFNYSYFISPFLTSPLEYPFPRIFTPPLWTAPNTQIWWPLPDWRHVHGADQQLHDPPVVFVHKSHSP